MESWVRQDQCTWLVREQAQYWVTKGDFGTNAEGFSRVPRICMRDWRIWQFWQFLVVGDL